MFWAVIGSALFYFGMVKEFFFLWLIPFMGWHQMAIRVTLLADHCFANGDSRLLVRSVTPHFLGRIFIAPHNLGLHAEHHFFGDVACSDLPLVTSRLEATQRLADRFARSEDYWTVLRELTTSVR
jgi:fatty acid desaturase